MEEGVGLGPSRKDWEPVYAELKHRDKQLALKRRWLMGLPLSKSESKAFEGREFMKENVVPESLLREDDIFYETVKMHVQGPGNVQECDVFPRNFKSFSMETMSKLLSQLDYLTNKGLHHVATLAARGSIDFYKTRQGMKSLIKRTIRNFSNDEEDMRWKFEICQHLYELLHDPQFVRGNVPRYLAFAPQSIRIAAIQLLDSLEDLPTYVLIAMLRKLRGLGGRIPCLTSTESRRNRSSLIHQVRKICLKMLSELGERDQLQDKFAKALAIAVLSLRLIPGSQNPVAAEFYQFTPEIRILQHEILKAIGVLKTKVRFAVLQKLQVLLDPKSNVSKRCLRAAVCRFLVEYLFECCDMDTIPNSLIEALVIINGSYPDAPLEFSSEKRTDFSEEEIREEVDCILGVSALLKQIVLDLLPETDYAADFANAYADEMTESDKDEDSSNSQNEDRYMENSVNEGSRICNAKLLAEGQGESFAGSSNPSPSRMDANLGYPMFTHNNVSHSGPSVDVFTGVDSFGPSYTPSDLYLEDRNYEGLNNVDGSKVKIEGDFMDDEINGDDRNTPKTCRNSYLTIQEACDETSLAAYDLVGFMLKEFAKDAGFYMDVGPIPYANFRSSGQEGSGGKKKSIEGEYESKYTKQMIIHRTVEHRIPNHHASLKERLEALMGLK